MRTVAVLPFADLSPHGDQGHFGEGLSEELAFALSRVPNLHLISQTSAVAFQGERTDVREMGRQLGLKFIVEVNVRNAKQKPRIMVRPADVATGFQIWSEVYTFELRDVFTAQEEISRAVTRALRTRVWGGGISLPTETQGFQIIFCNLSFSHDSAAKEKSGSIPPPVTSAPFSVTRLSRPSGLTV